MKGSIEDVVTKKLIVIRSGSSVKDAAEVMRENRIHHLPVADVMDDIVGIITTQDLKYISDLPDSPSMPVDFVMSSPVVFITADTDLRTAILMMLEKNVSCLLVADKNDDAIGMITTQDLMWLLAHNLQDDSLNIGKVANIQTVGEVVRELSLVGI